MPTDYSHNLSSPRLKTRFLTRDDIETWAAFFEDKEAIELMPTFGFNSTIEMSTHWIERQLNRYKENTYGLQALIHKTSNAFIGQCGLIKQIVDDEPEIEVGYHIFKKYWGQGYAPEAARLFINYAFKDMNAESVISIIDVRNMKSQIVANKNELTNEKQTKWNGTDVFIYRMKRENWKE